MLPSDIARLVLMYLKDEGLTRSYQQFFKESPHLEELRCHPDVEPSVPYEKGLPEILNEYAKLINAIKDRLSCNQVVNSLWKMHTEVISQLKFQYTGNAGLLQTQEKTSINQRALSRNRLISLRKQQELQRKMVASQPIVTMPTSSPNSVASTSQPEISSALSSSYSAIDSSYSALNSSYSVMNSSHSVPNPSHFVVNSGPVTSSRVCVATSPIDIANGSTPAAHSSDMMQREGTRLLSPEMEFEMQEGDTSRQQQSSNLLDLQRGQVVIPEQRTPAKSFHHAGTLQDTPIGKSPKRKSATPRRLQGTMATTISPRSDTTLSANQWEDHEDGRDLPEVLESLIKNIEFQEKLAQNINKAIPLENMDKQAEPLKSADTSNNLDGQSSTSIEELLNLQMSDDTIHDIVQKTSSDPAFESLFSLFNQNSQDGSSQQLENLSNEAPAANSDIMTGQSEVPATLQSNQSHSMTDNGVVPQAANQSSGEVVPVCGPAATSSSTSSSSVNVNESRYTGQLNSTSVPPAATSSFMAVAQQDAGNQLTTSSTTQIPNPSTDQVVTLPVILNQSGPYQVVQQPNTGNSQGIILNSPASLPGGTIFVSPDGRILGTSGVVLQSGQPLQASGVVQSVDIRQSGMQGVVSSGGVVHNASPNNPRPCPIHETQSGYAGESTGGAKQSTGPSTRSAVTPSTVNQTNTVSSGGGQSEVLQLLGSMVQSDVGSLFSGSPEKSNARTPTSSKRTPQKARSRKRGARSPKTPSIKGRPGSQTLNRNNQNNNETIGSPGLNQSTCSTESVVRLHSNQAISETQNIFSAITTERQVSNPGLVSGRHAPQVSTTSPISPPVNTGKQRKHIQFKQVVLPRALDVGGSLELPSKQTRQSPASTTKRPRATRAKRQGSNAQMMDQSRPSDPTIQKTVATSANQYEMVPASKPANLQAQLTKSTPERVLHMPSDMSPEVNIAAQMLVCLSNSPPSLRQSPNRLQRLRRNSGCSPARSPTRDHIVELRKEIGLTPKHHRLQQNNLTDTLSASTKTSLEQPHPKECSTGINEVNGSGGKSQDRLSNEQTQKKDANNSKRKSRTPRKQTHIVTETVVLTVPSGPSQKSKTSAAASDHTSAPSTIQTRAATLKSKSPGKLTNDAIPTRKSSRNSKSPGRPTGGVNGPGKGDSGKAVCEHSEQDSEKTESRGQKRSREENTKEQSMKKPKTAKNSKKTKKSKGFPSNLDVDKFLSSLQYAE
ncbi:protein NPAT-like [Patiria miniata]|uniref:LisH domain-containing protein n=1 Tax=Patiria miniata TaxID=46514 RepID=A0A914A686_PATMI|nr:protein NPAT-like [Patiria miniata]XP_038059261.1 protein NPAT-like [Patiria miniata]XP_038059262.1 protein NPAT-like [Patiria miniata]